MIDAHFSSPSIDSPYFIFDMESRLFSPARAGQNVFSTMICIFMVPCGGKSDARPILVYRVMKMDG